MNMRKKGPSYLWGLVATAAAMCALGQVSQAGSIGLMATQNQLPGDPPWRYTINVTLLPDATIASGTSITVGGLVGVDVTSGMTLPPGNDSAGNPMVVWFVPNNGVTTTGYTVDANGNTAPISTFTWEYIGPTLTYSDSNPALNNLGNFTVQTNAACPSTW